MKKTADGNMNKPIARNNPSAGAVNPKSAPTQKSTQTQGQRPVQKPVQRTAQSVPQRIAQKPVQGDNQRPVQKQGQRPVQGSSQRPQTKPVQGQRPVQKQMQKPQQGQKPAAKPVQRPASKPQPKQVQRPVSKPVQKKPEIKPQVKTSPVFIWLIAAAVVVLLGVLAFVGIRNFLNEEYALIKTEAVIEAGSVKPNLQMYLNGEPKYERFLESNLNFDEVNINLPQTIRFTITLYGKNFPCTLEIIDTVAPAGEGIPQKIFAGQELPDPMTCVTNVSDVTDVTASWIDVPDMSSGGRYNAYVKLMDAVGNETYVGVPFDVTLDSEAPVLRGAQDMKVYIGDTVTYRKNIIITDDYDENPTLDIDTSKVDLNKPGKYEVVYTARDFSGNETSVKINVRVEKKPKGYVEPDVVYAEAKKILDEITEPGMTDEEVALQIVWWCRYNIRFILRTYSSSWTEAAHNAFNKRTGNCYSTAMCVKAMLDVAGIDNMVIERHPYQTATHFWNYVKLNGQWYHCDATWRQGYDSYFFMYTTKELLNFWQGGWNGFQFKQSAFPESATESVQKRIDYKNHKIKSA